MTAPPPSSQAPPKRPRAPAPTTTLRVPTAVFAALTLLPAAILGWLGWRASQPLVDEIQRSARAAVERALERGAIDLPRALATADAAALRTARELAAAIAARLPEGADLAPLHATFPWPHAFRIRRADGSALWPRGPEPLPVEHFVERERWRTLQAALAIATDPAELLPRALALTALPLRAQAIAASLRAAPAHAVEHLARLPWHALALAGPLPFCVLADSAAGRAHLRAALHDGALWHVAAPESARAHWLAAADADPATRAWHDLLCRDERGEPLLRTVLPLPGRTALEVLRDAAEALRRIELPCDESCALTCYQPDGDTIASQDGTGRSHARSARPASTLPAPGPAGGNTEPDDARAQRTVATSWGRVVLTARHLGLAQVLRDSARQRQLTSVGVVALLAMLSCGIALARRAMVRERAARALRDDFIASASHELKTPLTSLRLYAEMLADDDLDTATRADYREVVRAEGARLSSLVDNLLDFAALERGQRRIEPEPVDLAAAARALAAAWRPLLARERVEFTCAADGEVPALADPIALSRILANLMQNALRHGQPARDGGRARVVVSVGPGPCLTVRDNGPGIAPDARARLFTPYARGDHTNDGLGLGLALSRALARACDGDLTCDDDGATTMFSLRLPPAPDLADPAVDPAGVAVELTVAPDRPGPRD